MPLPLVIGGAVVVVVGLFLVIVARRPAAYRVERSVEIAAPAAAVFAVLNDLRRFAGVFVLFGEPWEKIDPKMQKTFDGPAAGVGQSLAWVGNRDAGTGSMAIEESVADQKVGMKLTFVEPMASTAAVSLTIAPAPAGCRVTWSMAGDHNFIGKVFATVVDTNKMLGKDLDKGLALLKTAVESNESN